MTRLSCVAASAIPFEGTLNTAYGGLAIGETFSLSYFRVDHQLSATSSVQLVLRFAHTSASRTSKVTVEGFVKMQIDKILRWYTINRVTGPLPLVTIAAGFA